MEHRGGVVVGLATTCDGDKCFESLPDIDYFFEYFLVVIVVVVVVVVAAFDDQCSYSM